MTRVALVQIASPDGESQQERIARVEALLRSHADAGVELFVLPELWSAGYLGFDHYAECAETMDGPTVSMCRRVARELGAWVHLGSFIERDGSDDSTGSGSGDGTDDGADAGDGRLHNTAVLLDADGRIAQTYRKIHVFGYESLETQLLAPGDQLSVVPGPLGRLASTTCYDLRFPELWLEISARGAEAAIVPAAWPAARRDHFKLFTEARAVEHQLWMVAVNACGSHGGGRGPAVELGGCSRIVDPWGRVVAECSPTEEEVLVADIDPSLVGEVRREFPVIGDRLGVGAYPALSTDPRSEPGPNA